VSVTHLEVHRTARLLRASTYGRGVWERPLASSDGDGSSNDPHLYLRTHAYDDGRRAAALQNGLDPIDPRKRFHFLQGVDVKVDVDPLGFGSFQTPVSTVDYTPAGALDHIGFEALAHRSPRKSRDARVYVQVQNSGPGTAAEAKVRVFWAPRSGVGYPPLTAAFWTAFASDGEPTDGHWHAIAPPQTLRGLRPAEPQVATFLWPVPSPSEDMITLLAVVGGPAARAEPHGAPDELLRLHEHFVLKDVSLGAPLWQIIATIAVVAGIAAGITYAIVDD
jgi:hypothetical protein